MHTWLRDATLDAEEAEDTKHEPAGTSEDYPLETAGFDPFEFQLANGNSVKIVFSNFWERLADSDRQLGAKPGRYYAIQIYSNEDVLSSRMTLQYELREKYEFDTAQVENIWQWLQSLVENRGYTVYDGLEDFVDDFSHQISEMLDEDAVEHFERLPLIADPESFDKVDAHLCSSVASKRNLCLGIPTSIIWRLCGKVTFTGCTGSTTAKCITMKFRLSRRTMRRNTSLTTSATM
jgi:hypothetical protein